MLSLASGVYRSGLGRFEFKSVRTIIAVPV